jgi:hypothetical protein
MHVHVGEARQQKPAAAIDADCLGRWRGGTSDGGNASILDEHRNIDERRAVRRHRKHRDVFDQERAGCRRGMRRGGQNSDHTGDEKSGHKALP